MVPRCNRTSVKLDAEYGGFIYEFENGKVGATTPPITSPCNRGVSCQLDLGRAAELAPRTRRAATVDHQGSVTLATRSDGATAYRTAYEPFGEASVPVAGYAAPNPFGYTGQRYEAAPALYDYGARFYDPQLGRFLQPDNVVPDPYTPQSLNRYSYVLNSPPNWTDPSGNQPYCETCAGSPGPDWEAQSRGTPSDWRPPAEPLWDRAIQWSSGGSRRSHRRNTANFSLPADLFSRPSTESGAGVGPPQGGTGNPVVNSTFEALRHYFWGNGEPAELGPDVQDAVINSRGQQYRYDRIRTGRTPNLDRGVYGVDVERDGAYFVGDTPIEYQTLCRSGRCNTTFTSRGDGFWDVARDVDRGGPRGELPGGTPYPFLPFYWQRTFPDPRSTRP